MRARLRSSIAVGVLLLHALPACGSDDEAPRTPGLSAEDQAKLPAPPAPAATEPAPARQTPTFNDFPSAVEPSAPPGQGGQPATLGTDRQNPSAPSAVAPAPAELVKNKRDLSAELRSLLGQPTDCLDLQKVVDDGGKITVRVSVYVGPSGRITRATINAPGQPGQALSCIERRAVALKMQEPIDDAPRLVEAELSFEIARNQAAPPTAPPPEPSSAPRY